MSYARQQSSGNRGHHSVVIEVPFALLYLLLIEHAKASPLAVCEPIDNRPAEIIARQVVDCGTAVGPERSEKYDKKYIQVACCGMIGCGRYYEFRRYRDNRALEKHQKKDRTIV